MKSRTVAITLLAGSGHASVLANPDQVALDLRAAHILNLPQVQAEKTALRALYEADPQAAMPSRAQCTAPGTSTV
ncbi:MAG TPA: hypothetical protein VKZ79_19780 [Alphaproteobacteria bacterium]|nr:hypothetical protein [Alphaproteobacteria bacterium]